MVSFTLAPLTPTKGFRIQIAFKFEWAPEIELVFRRTENLLLLSEIEPRVFPVRKLKRLVKWQERMHDEEIHDLYSAPECY